MESDATREIPRDQDPAQLKAQMFASLFETMAQGVVYQARAGRIVAANPAAGRILGLSPEELLGRRSSDERWQAVREDGTPLPGVEHPAMRTIATGRPAATVMGIHNLAENRRVWLQVSACPLEDNGDDAAPAVCTIFTDITDLKRIRAERDRLFDLSLDLPCVATLDGHFQQLSPSWSRTLGWSQDELLSRPCLDFVHPEDQAATLEAGRRLAAGHVVLDFNNRCICRDGSYRWLSWNAQPMAEEGRVFAMARDVTELRRVALERERLADIAEATQDCVATARPDGRVIYLNRAARKAVGIGAEAPISGMPIDDLHPSWATAMIRNQGFPEAMRAGSWAGEAALLHRSGREIPVSVVITAHRGRDGGVDYLSAIMRDITERQAAEKALRRSEQELRLTLDATTEGIWKWNFVRDELEWSARYYTMLGYEPGEFAQTYENWKNLIHPDDLEPTLAIASEYLRAKPDSYESSFRLRTKSGEYRWIRARGRVVERDEQGRAVRMIGNHEDITEERQAEEQRLRLSEELELRVRERTAQLEAANQELEAFASSVSQDLRQPLRIMEGFAQALVEDLGRRLDETSRDHLERIRAASRRMAGQIDGLLTLSRFTRQVPVLEPVDLSALARKLAEELHLSHPEREVDWRIAEGLRADCDRGLVRTLLQNLLGNAWKFTSGRRPAVIEFGRSPAGGAEAFFVRDNGIGFDPGHAERIFGVFQRLHAENEYPGQGLGLATVQRVVRCHGGRIWAQGVPGESAVFWFRLQGDGPGR